MTKGQRFKSAEARWGKMCIFFNQLRNSGEFSSIQNNTQHPKEERKQTFNVQAADCSQICTSANSLAWPCPAQPLTFLCTERDQCHNACTVIRFSHCCSNSYWGKKCTATRLGVHISNTRNTSQSTKQGGSDGRARAEKPTQFTPSMARCLVLAEPKILKTFK